MQMICKQGDVAKVVGEDWDSLMWHNGKLFSGSYANGKISVWSPDLKRLAEFPAHEYPIYHMTSGNGTTFYTSSSDCTIRHWDDCGDGTFKLLTTLEGHTEPPRKLRYFEGRLYSGDEKGEVKVWQDGQLLGTIETGEEIWDLVVDQGHFISVRHVDMTLYTLVDRENGLRASVKNSIPGRAPMQISGNRLCSVDRNDNTINVHDMEKNGNPLIGSLKGHAAIINAMVPVASCLVSGGYDNSVICWNLDTLTMLSQTPVDGYVNAMTVSPQMIVYAAGEDKFIASFKLYSLK